MVLSKNCIAGRMLKVFSLVLMLGLFTSTAYAGGVTIVSIDTETVFRSHPAFHQAMEEFQAEQQKIQRDLEEMDDEERAMAQQVMQHQLQQLSEQLYSDAFGRMSADISRIAEDNGYDYVVDSNMLIFGGRDITEEVLNSFQESETAELPIQSE